MAFIVVLLAIVLADLAIAAFVAAAQGAGILGPLRTTIGFTALALFAGGLLLAGSSRTYPAEHDYGNSPILATPSFRKTQLEDREAQREGVSDYPIVGVIYGFILCGVTVFLYLLPGA